MRLGYAIYITDIVLFFYYFDICVVVLVNVYYSYCVFKKYVLDAYTVATFGICVTPKFLLSTECQIRAVCTRCENSITVVNVSVCEGSIRGPPPCLTGTDIGYNRPV